MVLVVSVALKVMRMGETMRIRMCVGALFGAAGIGMVVHADGVACAAPGVNRRVIA